MSLVSRVRALVASAWSGAVGLPWLGEGIAVGGTTLMTSPVVTARSVLALTAVYRACSLLSDAASTAPPAIYVQQPTGGRSRVRDTAAARALATLTQSDGELFAFSCALLGNGYLQVQRDGNGAPYELRAIPPWRAQVEIEQGSRRVWYRIAPDAALEEPAALLPERDVIHARYRTTGGNRLLGVPPVHACAPAFALALQSRDVQRVLFDNLSAPRGALVAPGKVDPVVAKRLREEWDTNFSGRGLGKTAVLSNGLEYQDVGFKAVDAQLLDTIKATTADVARAFGVPRQFLEDLDHLTFASAVEGTRALYALTLRGFTARLADAIAQRLLSRDERATGTAVEFDLTALLLLPGADQAEYLSKLVNSGLASPNELRNAYLNLPDVPGGDALRVPTNTAPLDRWAAGNSLAPVAAGAAA